MKRLFIFLCCFLLCFPASAAEPVREKYIAITFDDGPSGRFTRRLLEGLSQRDAHATFFLCGYRIIQYPDLATQIWEGGHEIGLHGYSHCCLGDKDACDVASEITRTRSLLPEQWDIQLFRTPGGKNGPGVITAAKAANLSLIGWSVDPRDWATDDAATIVQRVLSCAKEGDIILLHDMSDSSVNAALSIIDTLQAQGYHFVTVSELAEMQNISLIAGNYYASFPPDT